MNLSLKNRVAASFIIACFVVLVVGFTVFFHLNSLNKEIESITVKSNRVSLLTDEIRISAVSILKYQRRILSNKTSPELVEKLVNLCDSFTSQLKTLDSLYRDADVKRVVAQMQSYVDSLKVVLGKASLFHRDNIGMASIGDLADKILDAFSEFQDIQYFQSVERDEKIKKIIKETKRNMMITLIISFLGTIILGLVVPGKIALPFKKIKDAIRELQDCNFDVSIYYSQDDEIGEIAREMNKMIHSFKVFEELRTDRISLENRKFDALANLVKKPVLLANANSQIIYMNSHLYSLLQVQSEDVIGKVMTDTLIPEAIISTYQLAIKRRSKIENADIVIPPKKIKELEVDAEGAVALEEEADGQEEVEHEVAVNIFQGYGNVIPIRGKESSMDYYLMVLSEDVHV
ncbi:HAMP domain-containing protein [Halobacteriovorax sp. HLS]|uniref:HAMP domain-containing protein n=1 Tax=Halobacteriovorax sp. HLS TaxID=2234000 RepID=UPI000FD82704|nr:HAMP domain-containing protein [Halobacteriovorax sp. HLS]